MINSMYPQLLPEYLDIAHIFFRLYSTKYRKTHKQCHNCKRLQFKAGDTTKNNQPDMLTKTPLKCAVYYFVAFSAE